MGLELGWFFLYANGFRCAFVGLGGCAAWWKRFLLSSRQIAQRKSTVFGVVFGKYGPVFGSLAVGASHSTVAVFSDFNASFRTVEFQRIKMVRAGIAAMGCLVTGVSVGATFLGSDVPVFGDDGRFCGFVSGRLADAKSAGVGVGGGVWTVVWRCFVSKTGTSCLAVFLAMDFGDLVVLGVAAFVGLCGSVLFVACRAIHAVPGAIHSWKSPKICDGGIGQFFTVGFLGDVGVVGFRRI